MSIVCYLLFGRFDRKINMFVIMSQMKPTAFSIPVCVLLKSKNLDYMSRLQWYMSSVNVVNDKALVYAFNLFKE